MKLRTLQDLKAVRGKRVLIRLDLNAPVQQGHLEASDLWKLRASIHTVEHLAEHGAKVIIVSHFGRPNGKKVAATSLKPIVCKFSQMVGRKIELWPEKPGKLEVRSKKLEEGQIVALENIRWYPGEEKNDPKFAKILAKLADIYVNDAFGVIQRTHASTVGVTKYLPSYAGFLLEYEVKVLYKVLSRSKRPVVAVLGGAKISSKLGLLKILLSKVDYILLGGALANNVLQARDFEVGKSLVDKDVKLLHQYIYSNKLKLPVDVRVATSLADKSRLTAVAQVHSNEIIYDIGPDTVELFAKVIRQAKTVIWNGPLGYFEDRRYGASTRDLIQILSQSQAQAYVGGGETVKAVLQSRLEDTLHFVSTGGGAMLSLLEKSDWPALKALMK
ncbi:MAG: phosphoglycerate kinase [Candidatus Komeilibacteria bacterium]